MARRRLRPRLARCARGARGRADRLLQHRSRPPGADRGCVRHRALRVRAEARAGASRVDGRRGVGGDRARARVRTAAAHSSRDRRADRALGRRRSRAAYGDGRSRGLAHAQPELRDERIPRLWSPRGRAGAGRPARARRDVRDVHRHAHADLSRDAHPPQRADHRRRGAEVRTIAIIPAFRAAGRSESERRGAEPLARWGGDRQATPPALDAAHGGAVRAPAAGRHARRHGTVRRWGDAHTGEPHAGARLRRRAPTRFDRWPVVRDVRHGVRLQRALAHAREGPMTTRRHRRHRRAGVAALLMAAATLLACTSAAQWSTTYEQHYLADGSNWAFRNNYPASDRLFNAFDYGHAILYERLYTRPYDDPSTLEQQEYDFITKKLLLKPPRLPLEESAIEIEYAKLVPEAKQMFEWAHVLHRQVYDVWADERIPDERKDGEVNRLLAYYKSRRDVAFSSRPKDMHLMEGQPYSLAFRRRYPKFNGLIWAYHWLQVGLYEPLVTAKTAAEREAGVNEALARFRAMLDQPPSRMPSVMPMTSVIAPEFSRRYPEAAIIFDNLHAMHDVISDVLADSTIPRSRKRAEILTAAARYRDDTTSVTSVEEWRSMAISMGVARMGGPASGAKSTPPAPVPSSSPDAHAHHTQPATPTATTSWSTEMVEQRLRDGGVAARPLPSTGRHIFMSMPATSYQLEDGDELQLFIYADSTARARDTDRLDTRRVAPPDMMIKWRAQPSLIVDRNLAAIVITNDEARRQRVRDALLGTGRAP